MKKFFAAFLVVLLATSAAFAEQKPINLNAVKPVRHDKCLVKVAAFINGKPYGFSRLQGMEYTKADGTVMTVKNPKHPWNDCNITNIGEVTKFSTGLMKNGLNIQIQYLPDDAAKKKYITTYADRRDFIMEKMEKSDVKMMDDYTNFMKWTSAVMYVLPGSAATANEEPVAIYCKLPAGVKDDHTIPREQRRKLCSTRYILPEGLGFGYNYLESEREYKPTDVDKDARLYFSMAPLKPLPKEEKPKE